jgi:hypothetical protein
MDVFVRYQITPRETTGVIQERPKAHANITELAMLQAVVSDLIA